MYPKPKEKCGAIFTTFPETRQLDLFAIWMNVRWYSGGHGFVYELLKLRLTRQMQRSHDLASIDQFIFDGKTGHRYTKDRW
jgi:hypothetical protein